ncbi:EI24 domain-containing protein [bacterium]|nr:EI24 domain-containing protein [bacterium]
MADAPASDKPAGAPDAPVQAAQPPAPAAPATTALTKADLAKKALIPLAAGVPARCPRCGVRLLETQKACPRCGVDPASEAAGALLVPEGSWLREIFRGASYVPRGFWKILTTPRLWPVAALPFLVNVIIFVLVSWLVVHVLRGWLEGYVNPHRFDNWTGLWWGIASWLVWGAAELVYHLAPIMVPLIVAWLIGAFPFSLIFRIIFAPLATIVSERTEQIVLDLPQAKEPLDLGSLAASITASIINSILLVLLQGLVYIVLIPIGLIPFFGTLIWLVLPPAILAGMDHTDPNFCRKDYWMRERTALWKARHWRFLGFGLTFFFLLGIPFVNAFVFPTVAAGSALLYLELDRK